MKTLRRFISGQQIQASARCLKCQSSRGSVAQVWLRGSYDQRLVQKSVRLDHVSKKHRNEKCAVVIRNRNNFIELFGI